KVASSGSSLLYLDPHAPGGSGDYRHLKAIYDVLVALGGDGTVTSNGALASKWEQPDPTTYVMQLRTPSFHDGTPFNATAAKFNFDRVRDPATGSTAAADLAVLDKVEVINETQLRLTTTKPWAPLLPS